MSGRFISSRFLAVLAGLLFAAGCSDAQKRAWKPQPAAVCYKNALEADSPDDRRDAVARIAESSYVHSEDAFHVLDTVARTDAVDQVRCVAIKAFSRYADSRPVSPLLAVLQAAPGSKQALPAGDDVRWEAACVLLCLERRGLIAAADRPTARQVFIKLMADPCRNVRIVATEALGSFKDRAVLRPLIDALRTDDFAIADASERSLIALTGVTHNYDANEWESWLASAADPFARAGQKPLTTRPAGPTWFDQQIRAWRRGLKLGNPN